jgi:hypothetical protein
VLNVLSLDSYQTIVSVTDFLQHVDGKDIKNCTDSVQKFERNLGRWRYYYVSKGFSL